MTREEFSHSSSDTQANLELSEIAHLTENGFPGCGNTPAPAPPGPRHPSVPLPCSRYRYSLSTTETRTFRSRHSRCCVGTAAILLSLLTVGVFLGIMIHFTVVDILWKDDEGVSKQPVPRAETKLGNTVPDFLGSVKISNLEWDYTLSVSDSLPYRELAVAVEQELDRVFLLSPLKDIYNFSLVRTFRRGSIVAVFETVLTDHRSLTTDSLKEALVQGLETRNYIRGSGDVMETKHGVDLDAESIQIVTISTTSLRDQSTSHLLPILDESEQTNDSVTRTTTVLQEKTEESSPKQEATTTTTTSPPTSTDDENNADSHTHIWIWRPPKTPKQTTKASSSGLSTESTSFSPPKIHSSTHVQSTDWHTAFWKDQFSNKQFPFSDFWYSSSTHIPKTRQTLPYYPERPNPDESKDGQLSENPQIPSWTTGGSAVSEISDRHPSDKISFQDSTSTPMTGKTSTSKNTKMQPRVNSTHVTNDSSVVTNESMNPSTNTSLPNTTTITSITVSSNSDSDQSFKPLSNENDNSIPKVLSELKKDDTDTDSSNITNVIENIPHDNFEHHHAATLPVDESPRGLETNVPIFNEDVLPVITPADISEVSEIKTHANGHSSFDSESQQTYTPVTKLKDHQEEYPADLDHVGQFPQEGFELQEHGVLPSPTPHSFEDYNLHETSMENYDYVPRYPDVNLVAQNDANDEGSFRTTSPSGAESSHEDVVEDDGGSRDEVTQWRGISAGKDAAIVDGSSESALTVDPSNTDRHSKRFLTETGSGTGSPDGSTTVALATQKTLWKRADIENARDENLNEENGSVLAGPVIKNVTFVSENTTLSHINNNTHLINHPALDEYKADVNDADFPWENTNTAKDNDMNISESLKDSPHRSKTLESNIALKDLIPSFSKEAGTVMPSDMIRSPDTTVQPSQTASVKSPSEQHKDVVGVASSSKMLPVHTDLDDLMPVLQSIAQDSAFDNEAFNANPTPVIQHTASRYQDVSSFSSIVTSSATVYTTDSIPHRDAEMVAITPTSVVLTETVNGIQMLSSLLQPQMSKQLHVEITTPLDKQSILQPKVMGNPASRMGESSVLLLGSSALFDADASVMSIRGSVEVTPMLMSKSDDIDGATILETRLTNMFHSVVTTNIHTSSERVGTILQSEVPSVEDTGATDSYVPLSLERVNNPVAEPSETKVNSPAAVSDKPSGSNSPDALLGANRIGQEKDMNSSSTETGHGPSDHIPMTRQQNLNVSDIVPANSPVDSHDVSLTNMNPLRSFVGESVETNLTTKLPWTAEPVTLERKMHQVSASSASPTDNTSSTGSTVALDSVLMTTSSKTPGIIQSIEQQSDSKNVSNSNPEALAAVLQESGVFEELMNSTSANTLQLALNMNRTMTNSTNLESDSNVDNVPSTSVSPATMTQPKDVMQMFTHSSTDVSSRRKRTTFHQEDMVPETARGWRTPSITMKDVDEDTVDSTTASISDATSRWMAAGISTQDVDTMETSTQDITGIPISGIPISTTYLASTEVDVSLNKEEELGSPYSTQSETGIGSPQTNACLDITVMTEFIPSCLDYFSEITHTDDELEKCQHFLAGVICVTDEFYKYSGQQCTDTEISAFIKQHADLFKNALPNFDPLKCVV